MSHVRQIAGALALGLVVAALAAHGGVPPPPQGHLLTFEVLGASQVVVVDASTATEISAGPEGRLSGRDLALHVLRGGQRFDLVARRPLL